MDNRETLTASSRDAILKRHLFSGVAKNWIKGRGDVGRVYFVRRPSRQSFGFRVAASSGPIPKAPGSAGGYLLWVETTPRRCRDEHDLWCNRVGTDRRIDAARLQLFEQILGCVSGTAQTPEVTSHLVRPK